MQSRRQQKVGRLLQRELGDILQKEGSLIYGPSSLVTISDVQVSPDLLSARVFVSIYNAKDNAAVLQSIRGSAGHIRGKLGNRIRNQMRRIPELDFQLDDSLDKVFKMEQLLNKARKGKPSPGEE